mgnify:CR=1 FL=1
MESGAIQKALEFFRNKMDYIVLDTSPMALVSDTEEIAKLASHGSTMVIFLSTGMLEKLSEQLIAGGYAPNTPAAIVYKATWPEEESHICTVETLAQCAKEYNITKTALIIVGDTVAQSGYNRSELYHPAFTTEFRQATQERK